MNHNIQITKPSLKLEEGLKKTVKWYLNKDY